MGEETMGETREIYFAGGCFWGVEEYFSRIRGVSDVKAGYANGITESPSYREVCSGRTKHAETCLVRYDPAKVSLRLLVRQFFMIIDPLSVNRQGNDVGSQYRTGIYYTDKEDLPVIEEIFRTVEARYGRPLAVEVLPLENFSLAEDYHQDYLKKNPHGYCHISFESLKDIDYDGDRAKRDSLDPSLYRKPSDNELKQRLSAEEYEVTQKAATEAPYTGKYVHSKERGLYVDIATNEPLFFSSDKFDSGCGWPSFVAPVDGKVVKEKTDSSFGMVRQEVRSRVGDSHLGHVFDDGPKSRGGLRYCINSAALRFVPLENMEKEGYGDLIGRLLEREKAGE